MPSSTNQYLFKYSYLQTLKNIFALVFVYVCITMAYTPLVKNASVLMLQRTTPRYLALGSPSFSAPEQYNLYDQAYLPVGLLESKTERLRFGFGVLNHGTSGDHGDLSSNSLVIPAFDYLSPRAAFSFYYRKIGEEVPTTGNSENSLDLHNLGVDMAFGPTSQVVQMGVSMNSTIGRITDNNDNVMVLPIDVNFFDLSFVISPHSLIRLGAHGGISGAVDTIRSPDPIWQRYGYAVIPEWGIVLDFSDTAIIPLQVNMSLDFHTDRSKGTWKESGVEYDLNPLWTNYRKWDSRFQYIIEHQGFTYAPSLLFGFQSTNTQRYQPGKDRNNPFDVGDKCIDNTPCNLISIDDNGDTNTLAATSYADGTIHDWGTFELKFGLGWYMTFLQYGKGYTEVTVNTYRVRMDNSHTHAYMGFLLGGEANLHKIPQWKIPPQVELFLRGGLTIQGANNQSNTYRPYHYQFFNNYTREGQSINSIPTSVPSQGKQESWFAINLGLGTTLLNKRLGGDFYTSLLYYKTEDESTGNNPQNSSGVELGIQLWTQF